MRLKTSLLTALVLTANFLAQPGMAAGNLLANPSFTLGNTGFTSDYTYVTGSWSLRPSPGLYSVGTNPNYFHPDWSIFGDHTSGSGNMMLVNGGNNSIGTDSIWRQTVTLVPNQNYQFTAWGASTFGTAPAQIALYVGGAQQAATLTLSTQTGLWQQYSTTFSSPVSSTTLEVRLMTAAFTGNDMALDDLSLLAVPEPATASILLLGIGLLGWRRYSQH